MLFSIYSQKFLFLYNKSDAEQLLYNKFKYKQYMMHMLNIWCTLIRHNKTKFKDRDVDSRMKLVTCTSLMIQSDRVTHWVRSSLFQTLPTNRLQRKNKLIGISNYNINQEKKWGRWKRWCSYYLLIVVIVHRWLDQWWTFTTHSHKFYLFAVV